MKVVPIIVLMLITITDVSAHETLAIVHSHVFPNALYHAGALTKLVIVATTAVCFCAIVNSRRLSPRTE